MISMKAARNDRNMTLDDMAAKLGVCKTTVIKWEHNRIAPKPEQHVAYCNACGRSPSEVWFGGHFILSEASTASKWKG